MFRLGFAAELDGFLQERFQLLPRGRVFFFAVGTRQEQHAEAVAIDVAAAFGGVVRRAQQAVGLANGNKRALHILKNYGREFGRQYVLKPPRRSDERSVIRLGLRYRRSWITPSAHPTYKLMALA